MVNLEGTGEITGVIGGSTATNKDISIIKLGAGTWTISGNANNYTGRNHDQQRHVVLGHNGRCGRPHQGQ